MEASITATHTTFSWNSVCNFLRTQCMLPNDAYVPDLSHLPGGEDTWSCGVFKSQISVANCPFQSNRWVPHNYGIFVLEQVWKIFEGFPWLMEVFSCMNYKCEVINANIRTEFMGMKFVNVVYAWSFHGKHSMVYSAHFIYTTAILKWSSCMPLD